MEDANTRASMQDQPQVVAWEEIKERHVAAIQMGNVDLTKKVQSRSKFRSEGESDSEIDVKFDIEPYLERFAFPRDSHCIETKREIRNLLITYYTDLFPFKEICAWLCYGKPSNLCLREFACINWKKDFSRYLCYRHFQSFRYWMCTVVPSRIEIGGICNRPPQWIAGFPLRYEARELTFDIDMSDYNDVRMCCTLNAICKKCWKFIVIGCEMLQASFTEDFGWKHMLWVFSGRRGVHCWICDDDARLLDNYERRQIVEYFLLKRGTRGAIDLGKESRLHPHIERSCRIARKYFVRVCINEQNILGTVNGAKHFISLLPTETIREKVTKLFNGYATGRERWQSFYHAYVKDSKSLDNHKLIGRPHYWDEIVLYYLYPRIDTEVTEKVNHLLKSPFSFHPETNKLCTPFDPRSVGEFDVSAAPNLYDFVPFAKYREDCILAGVAEPKSPALRAYDRSLRVFQDFLASFGRK